VFTSTKVSARSVSRRLNSRSDFMMTGLSKDAPQGRCFRRKLEGSRAHGDLVRGSSAGATK
jgi:hypothetical protein